MKTIFSKLAGALVALVLITSCSSDDSGNPVNNPNNNTTGHVVEYKLTTSVPTVTAISYTNAEGNEISVSESFSSLTSWSKTINVDTEQFNAGFYFEAESPMGSPTQYSMQIFVDGVLRHSDTGMAIGSSTNEISYHLSNL